MKNFLLDNLEKDVFFIYSPNRCSLIFFNKKIKEDVLDILENKNCKNKKLLEVFFNEDFLVDNSSESKSYERPLRTLYLSLTNNCNLNCVYCLCHNSFAKNRNLTSMTKKIANDSIEKFNLLSKENEERETVFYGGEPLLHFDLIKWIYNRIKNFETTSNKNLSPSRYILCTNGTLINEEIAHFLKNSSIYPAISIDGPKDIHDKSRSFYNLNGSFDQTVKGYRILEKNGIQPGITLAYGNHNAHMIEDLIEYFSDSFSPKTIALNMMLNFEVGKENKYLPDQKDMTDYLWNGFLMARKKGIYLVKNVMDNRIIPFVERIPKKWGCTASGARFGVLPDGKIVPCMALSHKFNTKIEEIKSITDFCPKELMQAGPYQNNICKNCFCKATCGGGCPAVTILQGKPIGSVDAKYCISSKFFLKKIIELLWDLSKENALKDLLEQNFYLPSYEDRKKIYGNIKVTNKIMDFQHAGEQ